MSAHLYLGSVPGPPQVSLCVQVCTVFAQLTVGGKWEGPHVFVVRLRDDNGKLMPGVRIRDNGPKAGLNGVDNGQIWCACMPPNESHSSMADVQTSRLGPCLPHMPKCTT